MRRLDLPGRPRAGGLTVCQSYFPQWPAGLERTWGQWSPMRGRLMPGTAIFVTAVPTSAARDQTT